MVNEALATQFKKILGMLLNVNKIDNEIYECKTVFFNYNFNYNYTKLKYLSS